MTLTGIVQGYSGLLAVRFFLGNCTLFQDLETSKANAVYRFSGGRAMFVQQFKNTFFQTANRLQSLG